MMNFESCGKTILDICNISHMNRNLGVYQKVRQQINGPKTLPVAWDFCLLK